jgi:prepilin-type N-terminal cleavage/methylation domain-containing protein
MRKKGFTFIELMIAISIFLMMVVFIVKLDSNTHKQIKNITETTEKANLAYSELEAIKSNAGRTLISPKTVGDYRITITKGPNTSTYTDVLEIVIMVEKLSASLDQNPYTLKAHILEK